MGSWVAEHRARAMCLDARLELATSNFARAACEPAMSQVMHLRRSDSRAPEGRRQRRTLRRAVRLAERPSCCAALPPRSATAASTRCSPSDERTRSERAYPLAAARIAVPFAPGKPNISGALQPSSAPSGVDSVLLAVARCRPLLIG